MERDILYKMFCYHKNEIRKVLLLISKIPLNKHVKLL